MPRRMRCFRRNVTQASLSREGDRVSGGRSFSWHRVINFYTARVLLQSRPAPAPSRREPFIKSDLSPTEALKICCRNNAFGVELTKVERSFLKTTQKPFCKKVFCGAFFQKSDPKLLAQTNIYPNIAFSFGTKDAKEKALQKENAVFMGRCPKPHSLFEKRSAVPTAKLDVRDIKFQVANPDKIKTLDN